MSATELDTVDVVVLGTGAAGLTAALVAAAHGATVALLEKAATVGGTTAWSGGMVWIPNNPLQKELGVDDSREEALEYLASLSHDMIPPDLAEAYIDTGPEMVSWLHANSPVRLRIVEGFPDYHPEHPGGKPHGGRSMECDLFPFGELGDWARRVTVGPQMSDPYIVMAESPLGSSTLERVPYEEMNRRRAEDTRGLGQSLVGRLLKGCLDRGVEPTVEMRAKELVMDGRRVVGVRADGPSGPVEVRARGGVILATGGFEWDDDLLRAFIKGPLTRRVAPTTNTGDGLRMAMRIGASLGNMREAWWVPIVDVPAADGSVIPWQVMSARTRPRSIVVNRAGRRFGNEAANYNAAGPAFHEFDPSTFEYRNMPAWLVFDSEYLQRYGFLTTGPGEPAPAWVDTAPTLDELAERLGIEAVGLRTTVEHWNANVAGGRDPDFLRGASAHDNWWGDPALKGRPEATLGPLDTPPYYAVQVHPGALGTKGGPRTDRDAQVLDVDGAPIAGLYAAGNVMASAMGMTYGGAGGTLGPCMVFGYLAGRHAATAARRQLAGTAAATRQG